MTRFAARHRPALVTTLALLLCISCRSQDSTGLGDNALAPGDAVTTTGSSELRIAGGASGAEFALIVADTATVGSATSNYQVVASGISPAGSVSAPATSLAPSPELSLGTATLKGPTLDFSVAARLNERARSRLLPLFDAARLPAPSGRRSSVIPSSVNVGDIVTFNVSANPGDDPCTSITNHPARIVSIGTKAIIAVDTLNPTGGFAPADYDRFAANFDTLVYPLDVANFGTPTDIDQNGHIVLLFTRAVNELTASNSKAFTGGFFFDRDLFPPTSTTPGFACAGSNYGEMFYLLSPDPTGAVNGNVRTRGFVDSLITPLIGHEFQHLINGSRRMYVNNANDFEVVWLNEGLSHIAEELLFFRQSGLAPRQNLTISTLRGSGSGIASFNQDQSSNAGRYEEYLIKPSTSSPIRVNDSLSTRGATYDLLRYATDRKLRSGGAESDVWFALVNAKVNGIDNLRAVYGTDIGGLLRDWSVSHYTDDVVTNESADYTQPSWNWHNLFQAFNGGRGVYPLVVTTLPTNGTSGSIIPGGAAFYRFAVPANAVASVTLTGSSGTTTPAQGVVVRLR